MRWLPLVVLTSVLFSAPAGAQATGGAPPPVVGAFGGVNFSTLRGDIDGAVTRTAIQLGLFGGFPLGRHFAVAPSLAFSQQGTRTDLGNGITGAIRLDYLEAALQLKVGAPLAGNGRFRAYLGAGPAVGLELSCSRESTLGGLSQKADCDSDLGRLDTKSLVYSAHFGAGIEISRLFVGLKYQLGLTSIDDSADALEVKHRVLAIVAGYGFRLSH